MALSGTTTALAVAAAVVWAAFYRGTRPFRRLDASDIVSAKVECLPPDSPDVLNGAQIAEPAGFFREQVLYRRDDSYRDYAGQAVVFTLTLSDGTQTRVIANNPFLVIDEAGYRTKYEPCEKRNRFGNRTRTGE